MGSRCSSPAPALAVGGTMISLFGWVIGVRKGSSLPLPVGPAATGRSRRDGREPYEGGEADGAAGEGLSSGPDAPSFSEAGAGARSNDGAATLSNAGTAPLSNSGGATEPNAGGAPEPKAGAAPESGADGAPESNPRGAPLSVAGGTPVPNVGAAPKAGIAPVSYAVIELVSASDRLSMS